MYEMEQLYRKEKEELERKYQMETEVNTWAAWKSKHFVVPFLVNVLRYKRK